MATDLEMMAFVCHRTMGSNPANCMGPRCSAFRHADKTEIVVLVPGVETTQTTKGGGCYCADLKNDPWPVPGP